MGAFSSLRGLTRVFDPLDLSGTEAKRAARSGQRSAMGAEREMFDISQGFQREMWDWQKEQAAPWKEAGLGALGQYQQQVGQGFQFDPQSDPVYQQRLQEQSKAFGASGASRGMQLSGGTLKGLRDITGSELGASYGRQFDKYQAGLQNLGSMMNIGAQSSMGLAGIGSQFGGQQQQAMQQFGQGQAQGYQNIGAIQAQAAGAPFQNLMSLGQTAGGIMSGVGAMK